MCDSGALTKRLACLAMVIFFTTAVAAEQRPAVIADYGATKTPPNAAERPDKALRYRVVFNIT